MDIWGYCERCDLWFRRPIDDPTSVWTCGSCGAEPIRIENRAWSRVTGIADEAATR